MWKHYIKTGFRNLSRNRGYAAINIMGLAVGVTCCVLIMLFVRSEWSYDKFHSKSDRLYRVWQNEKYEDQQFVNTVTPVILAPTLQHTHPEIENTCRLYGFNPLVKARDKDFTENTLMVDSTFFSMFDFRMIKGDVNNPFPTSHSLILTKQTAKKYFGNTDAVGKTIELELGNERALFSVAGIAEQAPEASSIKYNMLIPFSNANSLIAERAQKNWFNVYTETYVTLRKDAAAGNLEAKFPGMMKQVLGEDYTEGGFLLHLQPITDIHLNNSLPAGIQPVSNPKYSYILATIGILILLVACINFITLSIGRSATRAMEVGVRKVMGAERQQLIRQFWGEALLLTLISVVIGVGLAALLVNPFNHIISRDLTLQFDPAFLIFCFLVIVAIAVIAGIYPAIILSGFNPVEILKGKFRLRNNSGWLRQALVTGQFVASIAMIVCTIMISHQMNYMKDKDLGYKKDQVVVVPTNKSRKEGLPMAETYRNELLKHPEVKNVTYSLYSFAETPWINLGFTNEKKEYKSFQYNAVSADFVQSMGIRIKEGRSFEPGNVSDINSAAVVNEAFVKEFGIENPIGKKLPGRFDQRIIGVVQDFNFQSLHTPVQPLLMTILPDSVFRRTENIDFAFSPQPRISVRLKAGNIASGISLLEEAWRSVAPGQDFEYHFLDETIASQYVAEQRTGTIVKIASFLSVFIACMGLFGLATLTVIRRTKEIGIRKVLGASVFNIVGLLSKDFAKLVVIATVLAFPLAWWFMSDWLKDFAYRINISWWVFVLAGLIALIIALATISLQSIKAAIANPVKSLRNE